MKKSNKPKSNSKSKSVEDEEWKKNEIYVRGEESDYIEEEEEAKRIQEAHLRRMINQGLISEISNKYKVESDEKENEKEKTQVERLLFESDEENDEKAKVTYKIPETTKKMILDYSNENEKIMNELKEIDRITKEISINKEKFTENSVSLEGIYEYFSNKKVLLVSLSSCICYFVLYRSQNMINDYHPVIKRIISLQILLKKLKDDKLLRKVKDFLEKIEEKDEKVRESKKNKENHMENSGLLSKKRDLKQKETNEKQANQVKDAFKLKEEKNRKGIEKANKELAKGRGLFRKRKAKQGNSKLMNKMKYEKKSKIRKRYVKEFTEAPINYTGQSTGVRRDLVRSVKFKY